MKGFRPQPAVTREAEKIPTSKRVYDELRRAIMHGELVAGTSLGETQVGTELGVSRTPVREAFAELLNQGLLEEGARRQVVIADPSPELIEEAILIRDALEPQLARKAAQVMDISDTDQLRLLMIQARRAMTARDVNNYLDSDEAFHLHIPKAAGLHLAEDAVRRLRGLTRLTVRRREWDDAKFSRIADEHEAVIEALAANDGEEAARAMAAHLAASRPY